MGYPPVPFRKHLRSRSQNVGSDVSAPEIQLLHSMGDEKPVVDGNGAGHRVPRVEDDACQAYPVPGVGKKPADLTLANASGGCIIDDRLESSWMSFQLIMQL